MVVVFEADWGWMGNELYEQRIDDIRTGAYVPLRVALDSAFAELPPGSQTALVSYAQTARVVAPLGPVEAASSAALGPQSAYNNLGGDLVAGVRTGIELLAKSPQRQKLLVVIGDGTHWNQDVAARELGELKRAAERHQITTAAVVLQLVAPMPPMIEAWTEHVWDASTTWNLPGTLRWIAMTRRPSTKV